MIRRPPRSTRTDTLCPYTTLFRSALKVLDNQHPPPSSPICSASRPSQDIYGPLTCIVNLLTLYSGSARFDARGLWRPAQPHLPRSQRTSIPLPRDSLCTEAPASSEERRVGKECGSTCRTRWLSDH